MENADIKYLKELATQYPNIAAAATEIVNLKAILSLPKATEHFITDVHGEYEQFRHVMCNGSGAVQRKIEDEFGSSLGIPEKRTLATLIYYPELKIKQIEGRLTQRENLEDWYKVTIFRLIRVCKNASSKYTRSKVRKSLPKDFAYIIEELMTGRPDVADQEAYYNEIINSVIHTGRAAQLIIDFCYLVRRFTVDHLHVVGDIFDRGPYPHLIMDDLMTHHSVDIQWGNHDILWMGAAAGSVPCMCNMLRISARYGNLAILEDAYGINMIPLMRLAIDCYQGHTSKTFNVHVRDDDKEYDRDYAEMDAMMHKAITIIQFKVEGAMIMRHPEYGMEDRLLLPAVDYEKGTVTIGGRAYPMLDTNFPTIDPRNPLELTRGEKELLRVLSASFRHSEVLHRHVRFLYSHGSIYTCCNSNLLYHGCIPMRKDGTFEGLTFGGKEYRGKELMDYLGRQIHNAYFMPDGQQEKQEALDLMWYLWCGAKSPVFGKDKMTTFEHYFVEDKAAHKENMNPYYKLSESEEVCCRILEEFGLPVEGSHIINGHVPVKLKDGEKPVKAGGKLFIIDGGLSKAYQSTTGIAGYTLIYNSHQLSLAEHMPFDPKKDSTPKVSMVERMPRRIMVADTDKGRELKAQIADLKELVAAYREGLIKERAE